MELQPGQEAPDFSLEATPGGKIALRDLRGKWVILYFYPRDNTPGCTTQACGFRDNFRRIESEGAKVLGISPDERKSHQKFAEKYELPFTLLSDPDHDVAEAYGVWKEKNLYGFKRMGMERSTFLIDPEGVVRKVWRKVKVSGHVDEVVDALKDAQSARSV